MPHSHNGLLRKTPAEHKLDRPHTLTGGGVEIKQSSGFLRTEGPCVVPEPGGLSKDPWVYLNPLHTGVVYILRKFLQGTNFGIILLEMRNAKEFNARRVP